MNDIQNLKQIQINRFLDEYNKSELNFTDFKAHIARTRLSEFNLIYSLQTMVNYGKSFTTQQLNPDVYKIIKQAINYKPNSRWYCTEWKNRNV